MIDFKSEQRRQYQHDIKNHFDVISLGRVDRLKHYGLHFAKYAGRFARGSAELKARPETIVDAALVCLSAANALNQELKLNDNGNPATDLEFTDAAGRFADACEKIDHLEDFRALAIAANQDIADWILAASRKERIEIANLLADRRAQLGTRAVYSEN